MDFRKKKLNKTFKRGSKMALGELGYCFFFNNFDRIDDFYYY